MSETSTEEIDNKIQDAYAKAEQVALIVVLKLIYETTKIDLYKDFKLEYPLSSNKSVNIKSGELLLTNSNNKKCRVFLDIVNKDYDFMKDSFYDTEINEQKIKDFMEINEITRKQIIGMLSYLTQSCLSVFNNLKGKYNELLEYNIVLDNNTTVYLDTNTSKRIGIVFKNCS
jgi:hypothetical protein